MNETGSGKQMWMWIIIAIVVIGAGWWLMGNKAPTETGPIKIGLSAPMSGEAASYGDGFYGGAAVAAKEINDAGGINGRQIELVVEDDQCNAANAVSAMTKLTSVDKVVAVVGPMCSAAAGASVAIAQKAGTPTMLTASAPGLTKAGDFIFRNYPSDSAQGKYAAEFVYNTLGKKKAAVLFVKNDYGQGLNETFSTRFKELGGQIVDTEGVLQTSTDMRTELAKIKQASPDILYVAIYPQNAVAGLKQIKEASLSVPVVGGDLFLDNSILKLPEAVGVIFTQAKTNNPTDFQVKVTQVTGKTPNGYSPYAYDAMKVLAQAIGKAGTDPKAIRNELAQSSFSFTGSIAVALVSFDGNRELKTVAFDVNVIKDGKAVPYVQ